MKFTLLHPADQIVQIMDRVYTGGMTTVSGGNISVMDDDGDIWITPSGIDKGSLTRNDICRVTPAGEVYGAHKPSMELPFHRNVYKRRPDLRAVLHAHPPALVSFSVARVLPDVRIVGNAHGTVGKLTMAAYAVPGSQVLGEIIAAEFEKGFDTVIMENHGAVIGAEDLHKAYMKFETLEATATVEIYARKLGTPKGLPESVINRMPSNDSVLMEQFAPTMHSAEERAARRDMATLIHRAYRQKLCCSTQGTYSARLSDNSFIITPYGADRAHMEENDLVLIRDNKREQGKLPSRSVKLHQKIYENFPEAKSILGSNPPYAMAFAVTDTAFDPRTIPESYIMLRQVQKVPFDAMYLKQDEVAGLFTQRTPVLICGNNQIIVTGNSLINAFDRLEVMEATARSIISAREIGSLVPISDEEVKELDVAFNLN
ncbi:MAG: class II aldolase/adducin family protein [Clostridiales bacterium]|jgi:L-fuculose-phosphate aldolase|nr:class II aldolase/adducin family protein [Clostridiales bacterium]